MTHRTGTFFQLTRVVALAVLLASARAGAILAEELPARKERPVWPGITPSGKVILPNGWSLRPAGRQTLLGDFPVLIEAHPTEPILAILHAGYGEHEVVIIDELDGRVISRASIPETYSGMDWGADGKTLTVGGGFDDVLYRFDHAKGYLLNRTTLTFPKGAARVTERLSGDGTTRTARQETEQRAPAGLAVASDGTTWVACAFGHSIARFDASGKFDREWGLESDSYPYGIVLDETTNRVYVSLWNRSSVLVIDTKTGTLLGRWASQEHPNEMLLTKSGKLLYVANANRNTVSVFDTATGKSIEIIGTAIAPDAPPGSTPSSLSLTADEKMLFVVNANTNDVAVFNVEKPGASKSLGFIPTGWYPTSARLSRDGKRLFVANGKGTGSKANRDGPYPVGSRSESIREYIAGLFRGTLSTIPMPGPREMAAYSKTVYECSPIRSPRSVARSDGNPIPARLGEKSPITHCVYIIKENRTYDQVFGDIPEGNGDPNLCLFPDKITPNHHAIAREFVLLDNFYVDGEVSADGHEWTMGAYATDWVEKTWPLSYRGDRRVPYPSEGQFEIARPSGGYLWDKAAEKGVSYRSYGEFIDNGPTPNDPSTTKIKALQGHFDPKFRGYDLNYPDVKRAERFLEELSEFEKAGEMPRLIILRLPNDHTSGTAPGRPTVVAQVADNDLGLGMVIEGLSKSRFWKNLAVFVVEDDAQNGSDHVDAHRTNAMVISPYCKRRSVDSTLYSTSSMLRTMELILGLNPMSQFDASATPMYASFTDKPDLTTFKKRPAGVDLDAKNTATAWGAEASLKLNLAKEDQADDLIFNEIIWKAVKGADSPMPPPVRAAFFLSRAAADDDFDEDDD